MNIGTIYSSKLGCLMADNFFLPFASTFYIEVLQERNLTEKDQDHLPLRSIHFNDQLSIGPGPLH